MTARKITPIYLFTDLSICMYVLIIGTFDKIEHVFMVGGAGGVPHYTDYYKHVRLGDVVMSTPNDKGHIYVFCDKVSFLCLFGSFLLIFK